MSHYLNDVPEELLRCIFGFLHADEVFKLISTSSKLWSIADSPHWSNRVLVPTLDYKSHTIVFNRKWRKATALTFSRYQRLTGPFYYVVLTTDLISSVDSLEHLASILNPFSTHPLSSLTVEVNVDLLLQYSHLDGNLTMNNVSRCESYYCGTLPELPKMTVRHLSLIFKGPSNWTADDPIPEGNGDQWLCYLLRRVDVSLLQSFEFSLDASLLYDMWNLPNHSFLKELHLPALKRLCLRITGDSHLHGLYPIVKSFPYRFLYRYFFTVCLRVFLNRSSLEELHIICPMPEELQALRDMFVGTHPTVVRRISSIRITAEPAMPIGETASVQTTNLVVRQKLDLLVSLLTDLGFSLSNTTKSNDDKKQYDLFFNSYDRDKTKNPDDPDNWTYKDIDYWDLFLPL